MGFWNFKKSQKENVESSESSETKVEQTAKREFTEEELLEQRIEQSISKVLNSSEDTSSPMREGKKIFLSREYYKPLFIECIAVYSKKWKSITGEELSDQELDTLVQEGIIGFFRCNYKFNTNTGQSILKINDVYSYLESDAKGGHPYVNEGRELFITFNFLPDPYSTYAKKKKKQEKQKLDEQIQKLKEIVNQPILYGDSGKVNNEIDFDEEFNIFAEKLRAQKMDEISIFKLVSRMGELKKQYELVIKHPDRDLSTRLEAQVLLEFYEQIEKQEVEKEEKKAQQNERQVGVQETVSAGTEGVTDSIKQIERSVSTLTWLRIIDGLFGH